MWKFIINDDSIYKTGKKKTFYTQAFDSIVESLWLNLWLMDLGILLRDLYCKSHDKTSR